MQRPKRRPKDREANTMAPSRRGGGSRSTVANRRRNRGPGRKEAARVRVLEALGLETVEKIRRDLLSWDTGRNGREWQQSEGVVMQLLQQGFSSIEIKAIIPVGDSRIHRLRGVINNGVQTLHTRQPRAPAFHAVTESELAAFKAHCDSTWELEDGFPCAHRLPRQYFTETRIMRKTLHARYADDISSRDPNARVLSYSRFTQYVHFHYPGVRLTRSAGDVCDCCVRLKIQLSREDINEDEREELCKAKNMHLSAAIAQRRFVSTFIKSYVAVHAPHQAAVGAALPDVYGKAHSEPPVPISDHDEQLNEHPAISAPPPIVQIQAEDFGGGISIPHYGHIRPSVDYFNSNLIIQNFVVADITNGTNYVYFYDERAQGKGADALCSLRLLYHLTALHKSVSDGTAAPEISFSVLDNCVGQNKSRVVMMFFALLSVVFPYKKVVMCFLLPGHSHNIADRVVAWCRGATRGQNLYTPKDLVKEVNKIHSVDGVFLDHNDSARPFFTDWEPILSKYFARRPTLKTDNFTGMIFENRSRVVIRITANWFKCPIFHYSFRYVFLIFEISTINQSLPFSESSNRGQTRGGADDRDANGTASDTHGIKTHDYNGGFSSARCVIKREKKKTQLNYMYATLGIEPDDSSDDDFVLEADEENGEEDDNALEEDERNGTEDENRGSTTAPKRSEPRTLDGQGGKLRKKKKASPKRKYASKKKKVNSPHILPRPSPKKRKFSWDFSYIPSESAGVATKNDTNLPSRPLPTEYQRRKRASKHLEELSSLRNENDEIINVVPPFQLLNGVESWDEFDEEFEEYKRKTT